MFDYLFVQFYNNYCGVQSFGSGDFNFNVWNTFGNSAGAEIFLGVPGSSYSGGGYQSSSKIVTIAQSLVSKYGPNTNNGWFGGVMVWDVGTASDNAGSNGQSFARQINTYLKSQSQCGATPPPPPVTTTKTSIIVTSSKTSTTVMTTVIKPTSTSFSIPVSSKITSSTVQPTPTILPPPTLPPTPPPPPPPTSSCKYTGASSTGPGGLFYNLPVSNGPDAVTAMTTTVHLPPVLTFNLAMLDSQVNAVLNSANYDSAAIWKPNTDSTVNYVCPFIANNDQYQSNPTQMFIARPADGSSVLISNTNVNVRLPDKIFGMFLAYAMDEYGINPHTLMGLSAKESFSTAVGPGTPGESGQFLAADVNAGYDLYGPHFGYGTDGNKDGPFQEEIFGMSTAVSIFPGRFNYTPSQSQPAFLLDVTLSGLPQMKTLHDYFTTNMNRAVVLSALDLHWRYNALMLVPGFGMKVPWMRRSTRKQQDALEFATMLYVYNRGVYGDQPQKLCGCSADSDPINLCGGTLHFICGLTL